jgi:Bacterial pre-peptidase C-terminal domain
MNRPLPFLLLVPVLFLARSAGQPKEKSKDPPPRALYALQLAADPGKTTKLTLRGTGLDAATEVRLGEPKSTGKVVGRGRKTPVPNPALAQIVGDSEIDVEVTLQAEVPGGAVPLSLVGPGGEGRSMTLLVNDDTPRTPEKEPNDGFRQAMPVTAPVIVESVFKQPQDVDVYRIDGKAGDRFRIEAQAGRAGSPADVMLTLHDAGGRTVTSGDVPAGGRDPVLRITLPKDGVYYISVLEGFDQGGPTFVYRLAVRREP